MFLTGVERDKHFKSKGSIMSQERDLDKMEATQAAIERRVASLAEFERLAALDPQGLLSASRDAAHLDTKKLPRKA